MNKYIFNNLYLTKLYIYIFRKKIYTRLNKYFSYSFQNEYNILLKQLLIVFEAEEIQFKKNVKRLLKNDKYKIIEKILLDEIEVDNKKIVYELISREIHTNILKNNNTFFDFIYNNKKLKDNHQIINCLVDTAFELNSTEIFEKSLNYFQIKYNFKNKIIYGENSENNYLIKSIKQEKPDDIFEIIIKKIIEKEILLNILFTLEPKQQSKLEILFKYNDNEKLLKKEFEEIKRKTKNKNSIAINRVNKLLNYKKISDF